MKSEEWITDRTAFIKGLKKPTAQQTLLVALAEKTDKTKEELKTLAVLVSAEKATARAQQANKDAAAFLSAQQKAENAAFRKARNHKLYEAAGLLIMAGFVDTKTGDLKLDAAELLGALIGLSKVPSDHEKRGDWRRVGVEKMKEYGDKGAK